MPLSGEHTCAAHARRGNLDEDIVADELIRLGRGALLGLAGVVALEHCESRHFYGVSPPIRYAYRIRRRV